MRHPSTLLALVAVVALALSACGDDTPDPPDAIDDTPTASPSPSPTPSPGATATATPSPAPTGTATPTPTPTATAAGDVPALRSFCRIEPETEQIEHIEFAYPEGWQVEDGNCEFFDPQLDELEHGTEPDAAVTVRVADVSFTRVAEPGRETRDEIQYVGAVSGYQAVRIRAEATGEGLLQEGEQVLTYFVDLDPGAGEEGRTLIARARSSGGASFELAAEALDRIAQTIRIVPAAVDGRDPIVVTRVDGGNPYAVTYDGDCLRLHLGAPTDPATDEACDVSAPDGISGTILGQDELQVVVGLAPPATAFVVSDAAGVPYGAVTTSLEGAAAFAYEALDDPLDVRALDVEGERIATATLD